MEKETNTNYFNNKIIRIPFKDNSSTGKRITMMIYITLFEILIGVFLGAFFRTPLLVLFAFLELINLICLSLIKKANYKISYTPDLQYDYGQGKYKDVSNIIKLIINIFIVIYFTALLFNSFNNNITIVSINYTDNKVLFLSISAILISSLLIKNNLNNKFISNSQKEVINEINSKVNIALSSEVLIIVLILLSGIVSNLLAINLYLLQLYVSVIFSAIALFPIIKRSQDSINNILDINLPEPILFDFLSVVIDNHSYFCEYKSMRTRRSGNNILIEMDIIMPNESSIEEAYKLEMKLHNELKAKYPNAIPRIYIIPCNRN